MSLINGKQALAIAYAMKKKSKKMSHGGYCAHGCDMDHKHMYAGGDMDMDNMEDTPPSEISPIAKGMKKAFHAPGYAEGGFVHEEEDSGYEDMPEEDDDIVSQIMKQHYSKGGKVANDSGEGAFTDELPNEFDDLVKNDDLEFHDTGANSGDEIGDEMEDEERRDIVSKIMKSRKKKDRLPHLA